MSEKRPEAFVLALGELRSRLRQGLIPFDTRLAATEIAAEFGLSATPVREALSRLAGEGLLEDRRGEGFFVRRLTRSDIAALFRLSLAHLSMAIPGPSCDTSLERARRDAAPDESPVDLSERWFARLAASGGSRALFLSFGRIQAQLGAVRRLEPQLFADLEGELVALASAADRRTRARDLKAFFARRIRNAGRLAELLERGGGPHTL